MEILSIRKIKNTRKTPERYAVSVSNRDRELQYMPRSYGFEKYKGTPHLFPSEGKLVLAALNKYVKFEETKQYIEDHPQVRWDLND